MTELYLNGKQVFFDDSKEIKVTKENPYFTQSGSYTLDVILPMSIKANIDVFKHINRLDVSKRPITMDARLMTDNKLLLAGTATVTKINESEVTVQLLGGNSEINFLAKYGDMYIDEIKYDIDGFHIGYISMSYGGAQWNPEQKPVLGSEYMIYAPVYDETNDRIVNATSLHYGSAQRPNSSDKDGVAIRTRSEAVMPNLLYTLEKVIMAFNYWIKRNDFDKKPWKNLYIANTRKTHKIRDVLPHWTVEEFLQEISYFFNCTIVFEETDRSVSIISNLVYFSNGVQEFTSCDEYDVELSKDDEEKSKSLSSSNIKYDASSSPAHVYDILSDNILNGYETKEYDSIQEMTDAINSMTEDDRKKYIYRQHNDYKVYAEENGKWVLKQVNQFGALVRDGRKDSYIELRICPVGITTEQEMVYYEDAENNTNLIEWEWKEVWRKKVPMPSMENPLGDATVTDTNCVWNGIIGEEGVPEKATAEDRIQVMFIGDIIQYINGGRPVDEKILYPYPMPFTDDMDKLFKLPDDLPQNGHEPWSLSLARQNQGCLGELHNNNYSINTQAETTIDFAIETLPQINKVFIFKNKRYACKKLEYTLQNGKISPVVRGYFYEMTD